MTSITQICTHRSEACFNAKFSEFKIQNIVISCDVKFPIRLEGLAYSHGQFSSYEPKVSISLILSILR